MDYLWLTGTRDLSPDLELDRLGRIDRIRMRQLTRVTWLREISRAAAPFVAIKATATGVPRDRSARYNGTSGVIGRHSDTASKLAAGANK